MKAGWETLKLTDVAELQGRIGWKGLTAKEYTPEGPYFLSVHSLNYGDQVDFREAFHISQQRYDESPEIMLRRDDVLICKDGAGIGKVGIVGALPGPSTINSSLLLIRAMPNILPKYLYHVLQSPYFQTIVQSRLEGATTPHLYQRDIATFPVHLPPLEEQRRIVAVLDEAFAAIATATANAEKNLANARELFARYKEQIFESDNDKWLNEPLSACFRLKSGDGLKSLEMVNGPYPVYGGNGIAGMHNRHNLVGDNVIIGRVGALCGNARHIEEPIWLTDNAFRIADRKYEFDSRFLTYLLNYKNLRSLARQTAQPVISNSSLKDMRISFPASLDEQRSAAVALDNMQVHCTELSRVYQSSLSRLAALKQSLLHRAFTGELTATMPETIAA